uniref:Reverse transcriptase zinc-binding domain-containing protein n=1 Tax=Hordeum vulgare subsp. vulgare TaxID=112509 RepID=A0A8I7B4Z9_HORVV
MDLETLAEYVDLWHRVAVTELDPETPDSLRWAWECKREFSIRLAYAARLAGREISPTVEFTWNSQAPLQCEFFTWLVVKNRCWTSYRLAIRGLPHQDACPFCSQSDETINHLLVECVLARTVWQEVCNVLGREDWVPQPASRLNEWSAERSSDYPHACSLGAMKTEELNCLRQSITVSTTGW